MAFISSEIFRPNFCVRVFLAHSFLVKLSQPDDQE